jgi:beta-lactamase superfamily II metal-dependent hydrolase
MARPRASSDALLLHVFRVEEGLGNAVLLELPDGSFGVVDWGTQRSKPLRRALRLMEGSRLQFVAATHAHADHTLGLEALMAACAEAGIAVERLVYPASTLNAPEAALTRARIYAKDRKIPMSSIEVDPFPGPRGPLEPPWLAFGPGWEVRVLAPTKDRVATAELGALKLGRVAGNETSLVILFRFIDAGDGAGIGRALLPGDATPATLRSAAETSREFAGLGLDNQAFVVPHHGSSANLPAWIEPSLHGVVVVSAPTDSDHHPSAHVLERISQLRREPPAAHVFCTSYAGACAREYGAAAPALGRPGPCFEDVVVVVPRSAPAAVVSSSQDGASRRPYGYCGNVRT